MTTQTTTQELPLFGRVPKDAVMARYGRLMADKRCTCDACFAAGVEGPPRLQQAGADERDGRMVSMGVWLHGERLRENELAAQRFQLALDAVMARLQRRPS